MKKLNLGLVFFKLIHPRQQVFKSIFNDVRQFIVIQIRKLGAGLVLVYGMAWHADHHGIRRDLINHNGVGAYAAAAADRDRAQYLGTGADDHVVTDGGVALAFLSADTSRVTP